MINDYIRKEDALKGKKTGTFANGICFEAKACVPVDYIKSLKPADVVPVVHGRWEHGKCNLCGEHAPYWCLATTYHESMYCPNCGAKMDGKE